MPWFKSDDQFPQHPKVLAIPRRERIAAVGLWSLAGMWCAGQLTDGFVPDYMLDEFGATKKNAQQLVSVGLWETAEAGYQFHDWSDWQPTKAQVEAERAAARERMQRARSGRVRPNNARTTPNEQGTSSEVRLTPSRPVPSSSSSNEELASDADASTRIDPDRFDEFWALYPKKVEKQAAQRAWRSTLKKTTAEHLLEAVRKYPFGSDRQFIKNPATWLNKGAWEDEPAQSALTLVPRNTDGFTAAELDQILGPPRPLPQPPRGLDENAMWEWEQQTRRDQRAERVRQANAKLGRSA